MSALGGRAAASGVGPSRMSSADINVSWSSSNQVNMYMYAYIYRTCTDTCTSAHFEEINSVWKAVQTHKFWEQIGLNHCRCTSARRDPTSYAFGWSDLNIFSFRVWGKIQAKYGTQLFLMASVKNFVLFRSYNFFALLEFTMQWFMARS